MAELDPSKKVADRYLKREVLGEGTYGVVYKAIDTHVIPQDCRLLLSYSVFSPILNKNYWDFSVKK